MSDKHIIAAGAVVTRNNNGRTEYLVIHRGYRNDWSFPKGKADEKESIEETAKREILEETGLIVEFEKKLKSQEYKVNGKEKIVHYWLAKNMADVNFKANDEVDELKWLNKTEATKILSYKADRFLLEEVCKELGI